MESVEDGYLFGAHVRLLYQVRHVFTLQMHVVDKKHTRGLFVADCFAIEENWPALLEQITAGDDANTTVVAQSCYVFTAERCASGSLSNLRNSASVGFRDRTEISRHSMGTQEKIRLKGVYVPPLSRHLPDD